MRAVLVLGPPGAGKSTTLTALAGALEADDVRHAVVEVEALARVHPWPDDEAAFEHLEVVRRSFERRGYPLLLVGATPSDDAYVARLRSLLPVELLVVRLTARPEALRRRISAREPEGWAGLGRLLGAVDELAAVAARQRGVDLDLATDALGVEAVVAAIRARLA